MRNKPRITMTVPLSAPVTGNKLMDATKKVAGKEEYHQVLAEVLDDKNFYEIGRNSEDWSHDCVVRGDDGNINPTQEYARVTVHFAELPGSKFTVGVSNEALVENVRRFRDKLTAALNE